jgi:hypothetical protein
VIIPVARCWKNSEIRCVTGQGSAGLRLSVSHCKLRQGLTCAGSVRLNLSAKISQLCNSVFLFQQISIGINQKYSQPNTAVVLVCRLFLFFIIKKGSWKTCIEVLGAKKKVRDMQRKSKKAKADAL